MMSPIVMRLFRLAYGSWKIICMRLRWSRSLRPLRLARSPPSYSTRPVVGRMSCRMARPVVLLPQPLSPTRPSVSPRLTSKVRPSTAYTAPTLR